MYFRGHVFVCGWSMKYDDAEFVNSHSATKYSEYLSFENPNSPTPSSLIKNLVGNITTVKQSGETQNNISYIHPTEPLPILSFPRKAPSKQQ